ncbi:MAG: glycosyltransferase family 9 protein [Deltaproteobacteria bacterium]|nr:glycosyltransferase family 9 protein [Deltaproteobacteria bacterium]
MKLWIDRTAYASRRARHNLEALDRKKIKSIAVIKHAAMGDLVLTRPFLVTLRQFFPQARITFSGISHYRNGIPEDLVERVHISIGKQRPRPNFVSRLQSFRELGPHDLLFDLTSSTQSFWITRLNQARIKIGFIPRGGHQFSHRVLYDVALPRSEYKFEAETFLDQLAALGAMPDWPLKFKVPPLKRPCEEPYLLYFVSASSSYKCWPPDHFSQLLQRAAALLPNHRHIVLSGLADWERDLASSVFESAKAPNSALAEGSDAKGWAWIQNAEALISNDTGVRNYAIACNTPTLGFFTETLPFRYLPRFGNHLAVYRAEGGIPSVEEGLNGLMELLAQLK